MKVTELENEVYTKYGLLLCGEAFGFNGRYYLKAESNQGVRLSDGFIIELSPNTEVEKVDAEFVIHK